MHPHAKRLAGRAGPIGLPEVRIDENTPQPYRVFHALRTVMTAQKQLLSRRFAEKNAHMGQALSLWVLSAHDGMSQSDLADALNVARPTVTIMLQKMERAGLVERRPDENDNRYVRIYLTGEGRALHAELQAVHAGVVRDTIAPLSDTDQRDLERLLGLVQANIAAAQEGATEDPAAPRDTAEENPRP